MKSAALLGGQLVATALTGYAFQKVFAYYYGASVQKSIFDIAFALPTTLVYLSGLGFTHAIVASLFTKLRANDPGALDSVFSSLTNVFFLALIVIVGVTVLFSVPIGNMLAAGLDAQERAATGRLILWMLPLAVTFGLSSHLSAVALAWRIPVGQEILLLAARIAVVGYLVVNGHAVPLAQVAIILIGVTLLGLAGQWMVLRRATGLNYRFILRLKNPTVRRAGGQVGGFLVVALTAQAAAIYGRRMGTFAGPSVVALLGFANALVDPLSAILGRMLAFQFGLPLAARVGPKGDTILSGRVLTAVLALGTLVAVAAALLAEPIVTLLFKGGQFRLADVTETAGYLRIMTIGIPAAILLWVFLYPLLGAARHAAASVYVVGYMAQIILIRVLFDALRGASIAWAYSLCLWIQTGGAWFLLRRRGPRLQPAD